MLINCKFCETEFKTKPSYYNRGSKYCSRKCSDQARVKGSTFKCYICNKDTYRYVSEQNESGVYFCSVKCRNSWNGRNMPVGDKHPAWAGGKGSYRERAKRAYDLVCSNKDCAITGAGIAIPQELLDVDHIDGDRSNNDIKNLQILCIWCHGIKTRIRA